MSRLGSRITRSKVASSLRTLTIKEQSSSSRLQNRTFGAFSSTENLRDLRLLGDFVKWGSLGTVRTSKFSTGFMPSQPKPLNSVTDVKRAKLNSTKDLASIWDEYRLGSGQIGLSMKAQLYKLLEERATDCLYFVIPLWNSGCGYTTMFAQVQLPYIVFTNLEEYKARGTQASPYFTITFYTELMEIKDLVLIRGDIVSSSKLSDEEAKCLLETTLSFYLNDARYKLVEQFNKSTHDFDFNNVLQTLDMPVWLL